jgi:hypothetical protein
MHMHLNRKTIFLIVGFLWPVIMPSFVMPALAEKQSQKTDLPKCNIKQKVLFEMAYENYAWGYQKRGYFIDNKGKIKKYIVLLNDNWRRADSGYISKEYLDHNYQQADSTIGKINKNELCRYYQLIESASKEILSKNEDSMIDAGSNAFLAYLWDNTKKKYKVVFLRKDGDIIQDNLNPDAIAITNWLRQKFNQPRTIPARQNSTNIPHR